MRHIHRFHCLALAFVLLVGLAGAGSPPAAVLADGPCSTVDTDPGPPGTDPQPMVGGRVTDGDTGEGIAGATLRLFRCVARQPYLVATLTTDAAGDYASGSLSQAWYFVAAELSGPLAGMKPTTATLNPTAVIEVGAGDPDVDLAFQ